MVPAIVSGNAIATPGSDTVTPCSVAAIAARSSDSDDASGALVAAAMRAIAVSPSRSDTNRVASAPRWSTASRTADRAVSS